MNAGIKTEREKSARLWTKAPVANLVRYEPSGIYFVRAKVRGKLIRNSLETNVLSVAKLRLADVLDTENKAVAPSQTEIVGKMIFADALAIFKERQNLPLTSKTPRRHIMIERPVTFSKLGPASNRWM